MHRQLPRSTLFPYTTLFRSRIEEREREDQDDFGEQVLPACEREVHCDPVLPRRPEAADRLRDRERRERENHRDDSRDRKSTRLNSSHTVISYAVFCLKKKTN